MFFLPKALLIAVGVQFLCQFIKFATASVLEKRLAFERLVTFGGMPSAHSAFVTSLTASIGVFVGTTSELFALSAVFSFIVIFDAYKLRGSVQKQAILINKIQIVTLPAADQKPVNEMIGHSIPEIIAGIVFGLVLALPIALFLK